LDQRFWLSRRLAFGSSIRGFSFLALWFVRS
jgi:hypothetical protein